jgi:hypothetical protein
MAHLQPTHAARRVEQALCYPQVASESSLDGLAVVLGSCPNGVTKVCCRTGCSHSWKHHQHGRSCACRLAPQLPCGVHPSSASQQYIPAVHPSSASQQCIPAVHPSSASQQCIPAVHPSNDDDHAPANPCAPSSIIATALDIGRSVAGVPPSGVVIHVSIHAARSSE